LETKSPPAERWLRPLITTSHLNFLLTKAVPNCRNCPTTNRSNSAMTVFADLLATCTFVIKSDDDWSIRCALD
jgi:hypothetical protein